MKYFSARNKFQLKLEYEVTTKRNNVSPYHLSDAFKVIVLGEVLLSAGSRK